MKFFSFSNFLKSLIDKTQNNLIRTSTNLPIKTLTIHRASSHLHLHHLLHQSIRMSSSDQSISISTRLTPEINRGLDCWSVFSPASGYMPKDSLNLGQGFMNWGPPKFMREAANLAIEDVPANHYSIPKGRIRLRKALSEYYSESYKRKLDPESEIIVSPGANFAIYSSLMSYCSDGDEVIIFEPFFDQYIRNITFSGGTPVFVPLEPPKGANLKTVSSKDWKLDIKKLQAAITPRSKVIILNTPHNPVGKVFDIEELRAIGELAERHNLLIISDEVYDCLTFDEPHVRIATLSDSLWSRTITIGSAGKSFSATGWRIGWSIGPKELLKPLLASITRTAFCAVSPLQEAVASGFEKSTQLNFFENQRKEYKERRDLFVKYLDMLGLPYTLPDGAYFVLVETSKIKVPEGFEMNEIVKERPKDWKLCWFIAKTAGVVCIPPSEFYCKEHVSICENYIRIAFCKDLETLKEAGERLQKLKQFIKS
ncbi:pyridoxal phosphate-dependent transferase [Phakopsora pachyrhizi]|uniref:kynurenine--oxoglutarate transaminase n=1 Tax=Phakopsora pachyrhizi TaxID=170000 RepID=A0AAV0BRD8_PHAPC|nr:pyridoxal phosphate-dependent transferase [Phakopsora pachyrhizi]